MSQRGQMDHSLASDDTLNQLFVPPCPLPCMFCFTGQKTGLDMLLSAEVFRLIYLMRLL